MQRDKHTQAHKYTHVSCFYHLDGHLICFSCKLLMMHSYPTSFDFCRPHMCTAAHIRDVWMVRASASCKASAHLATRGLRPYEHCVSIFQDLCLPTVHGVLSCSPLLSVSASWQINPLDLVPVNNQQWLEFYYTAMQWFMNFISFDFIRIFLEPCLQLTFGFFKG